MGLFTAKHNLLLIYHATPSTAHALKRVPARYPQLPFLSPYYALMPLPRHIDHYCALQLHSRITRLQNSLAASTRQGGRRAIKPLTPSPSDCK